MTNRLITLLAAALLATTGACAFRPATSGGGSTVVTDRGGVIREIETCTDLGCAPATPDADSREDGAPVMTIPVVLRGSF